MLFVTVKQNRPIIIISQAFIESKAVSNFVDKTIILKPAVPIFKKDVNTFIERTSDVFWPPTISKFGKDSGRPPKIILNFYGYAISTGNSYYSSASDSTNL